MSQSTVTGLRLSKGGFLLHGDGFHLQRAEQLIDLRDATSHAHGGQLLQLVIPSSINASSDLSAQVGFSDQDGRDGLKFAAGGFQGHTEGAVVVSVLRPVLVLQLRTSRPMVIPIRADSTRLDVT